MNEMNDHKLSFNTYPHDRIENIIKGSKDGDVALLTKDQALDFLGLWLNEKEQFPKIPRPFCSDDLIKNYPHTHQCLKETYDDFKIRMRKKIAQDILDIKNHKDYGLRKERCTCEKKNCETRRDGCLREIPNNVAILNGIRPLKITEAISCKDIIPEVKTVISHINKLSVNALTSNVNREIDEGHPFTELHEEWWIEKEEELMKSIKENIREQKHERLYTERFFM
jgi:hypothetical protein